MTPDHIIPECYADTLLVEILLGQRIRNHKLGIGEVKNALDKNFKHTAAVGIIDNDKRKPNDFTAFELHEERCGIHPGAKHHASKINFAKKSASPITVMSSVLA